jgi:hypothetical protein
MRGLLNTSSTVDPGLPKSIEAMSWRGAPSTKHLSISMRMSPSWMSGQFAAADPSTKPLTLSTPPDTSLENRIPTPAKSAVDEPQEMSSRDGTMVLMHVKRQEAHVAGGVGCVSECSKWQGCSHRRMLGPARLAKSEGHHCSQPPREPADPGTANRVKRGDSV